MRLLSLLCIGMALFAQQMKLPREMMPIVEAAHAAPPEFAADALLRVIESGKIADKNTRRQLIQDAFRLGASAHFKAPMTAVSGIGSDTRAGSLSRAYQLKLDAISLQTRAVNAMIGSDPAAARDMFTSIVKPAIEPLPCDSALVYDLTPFYRTLGAVAQSTFTAAERKKDDHVQFLLTYIAAATSQSEAAPLTEVVKAAGLTAEQSDAVQARLSGQLQSMTPERAGSHCEGTKPATESYWRSDAAKQVMEAVNNLRMRNGSMLSDSDRASKEWQEQLAEVLKTIADWNAGQEKSESDYYHQKSTVYEALIELTPQGSDRDKLLLAFAEFIGNSNLQTQNPAEWFVPARALLERVRNSNTGEPAKVLAALESSGNPALGVYVALERVFGSQAPAWVTSSKGG